MKHRLNWCLAGAVLSRAPSVFTAAAEYNTASELKLSFDVMHIHSARGPEIIPEAVSNAQQQPEQGKFLYLVSNPYLSTAGVAGILTFAASPPREPFRSSRRCGRS